MEKEILDQMRPFFYIIGLIVVSQAGLFIKLLISHLKRKDEKVSEHVDHLRESIQDLSKNVIRLETRLDMFMEHIQSDVNNLGQKVRGIDS